MKKPLTILATTVLLISGMQAALVSRYTFDLGGNLGNDSVGSNNGTLFGSPSVGSTFDADRNSNVVEFTGGATGYIYAPINLSGGEFTISMWVKSDSWNNNRGLFQVQQAAGTTVDTNGGNKVVGAWVGSTGIPWGRIIDTSGTRTMPQAGPSLTDVATDGPGATWHHLAYRAQGSNYEVFLDGSLVLASQVTNYTGTLNSHTTIVIGRQGGEAWDGLMDDFQVYDNALSNGAIAALAVPEPSTALLGALSLVALLRRRRS